MRNDKILGNVGEQKEKEEEEEKEETKKEEEEEGEEEGYEEEEEEEAAPADFMHWHFHSSGYFVRKPILACYL